MKYWLLTTEYPPFFGGGISTYCLFSAKMFSQKGHAVTVFINDAGVESVIEETIDNVRILRFNPNNTGTSSFLGHATNLSYAFAQTLKKYIEKEGRPDVIEAQEYLGIAYYLLQYKYLKYNWCKDVPVLITAHSPAFLYLYYNQVPPYRYPDYWIGEMERFCLQSANLVVSPTHYLLNAIKETFDLTNKNVVVIPNPFEKPQDPGNASTFERNDKIVFFGKLSSQKGTFKLLKYFGQLWNDGLSYPLHLYGGDDIVYHPEGKTMGALVKEKYAAFISNGRLHLHPRIKPAEISAELSGAKVVIVPSTIDNLPYVVLEMMALGNIVLASKQGGQAEIITDSVDGFLFDHDQPETFGHQLLKILNLSESDRENIQQKAKQKIKDIYSLHTIYNRKMEVVEALLRQQKKDNQFPFTRHLVPSPIHEKRQFQKNRLSIVVPYYNMGRYVDETISSLQKTTYSDIEIIVVNDGSTDPGSVQQLDKYRNKPGIRVIDTTNKGLAATRNFGAGEATGAFLAFLDADDTVTSHYFSKAIEVLNQYENVHFVGCWTQYFDGSDNIWPTFLPEPPIILYHNTINSSALVYKRAAFLHKGTNDANMDFPGLEDYESVISLLGAGYRGVVLPEVLFQYRVRKNSMIRGISNTKKQNLLQYITDKHKNFYGTFATEIANLLRANGPGLALDNPSLDYSLYSKNRIVNEWTAKTAMFIKKHPRLKKLALFAYRKFKS